MDSSVIFHKLWVIESLPVDHMKTGRILVHETLSEANRIQPNFEIHYCTPVTREDLFHVLRTIRDEASTLGKYPMIHFECHGCPNGLSVTDGELIEWNDLRSILIQINYACRLNLVIVLAACNGAHLIKVATQLDRAPFWAVIGPMEEVTAGDIETDFGAFYVSFLETLDGDIAMKALNNNSHASIRKYDFVTSMGIFIRAYKRYFRDHCSGKGKDSRNEELLTHSLQIPAVRQQGLATIRKLIRQDLRKEEEYFNKARDRFFFIDSYQDNVERFSFSYQDLVKNLNAEQEKGSG